ncbi:MAG: DUF5615 family PIN-like protein [Bacteroidetes bacterium]|nr:DUF5615 family PIN-like protein [Bacteroidota bacterium]
MLCWIPEEGKDPGDVVILQRAYEEDRILVTADKDFGDLVFVFEHPHPAIIRERVPPHLWFLAKPQSEPLANISLRSWRLCERNNPLSRPQAPSERATEQPASVAGVGRQAKSDPLSPARLSAGGKCSSEHVDRVVSRCSTPHIPYLHAAEFRLP